MINDNDRYKNQLKRMNNLIHDWKSMNSFLKEHMPGEWAQMHVTKLVQRLPGHERFIVKQTGKTECVVTTEDEVKRLLEIIDLKNVKRVLEPFNGTGIISRTLESTINGIHVVTNDICSEHGDQLLYENALDSKLYIENGPFDAIITSPWFVMLDVAIPLMLKHCKKFLAIHCPAYYLTNAPNPRLRYIKKLADEKRILAISSMTRKNPTRMACIWLVIFKSKEEKNKVSMNHERQIPLIF